VIGESNFFFALVVAVAITRPLPFSFFIL
jgi:hypothetical protein